MKLIICCVIAIATIATAYPQRHEGLSFSNDAIQQAKSTNLIPGNAQIQNVQEGIELVAYESIPGNQYIDLFTVLGDQVPSEVINNLQSRVNEIGKS